MSQYEKLLIAVLREIDSRNKLLFMDTAYYRK